MDKKESDEWINNVVATIELKGQLKAGERGVFECPSCGKKSLSAVRAGNGHLHVFCEKCEFGLME